jgi:hypothetical protein
MSNRFHIVKISPQDWAAKFANNAHVAVFGKYRPGYVDRISYALLVIDTEKQNPVGYLTARELDNESVYWQFGGGIKPHFQPVTVLTIYNLLIAWHGERYKRISTYVKNDNIEYLKIALKAGFRIIGIRNFKGDILLELLKEFGEDT